MCACVRACVCVCWCCLSSIVACVSAVTLGGVRLFTRSTVTVSIPACTSLVSDVYLCGTGVIPPCFPCLNAVIAYMYMYVCTRLSHLLLCWVRVQACHC